MSIQSIIQGKQTKPVIEDFYAAVALGLSPYHSSERKFADRPNIDAADGYVDIWNYSAVNSYTYSTSADIDTISSSNLYII